MNPLLARRNSELLAQLAASNVLLAFDYDGTLAPIVVDRDLARMRERTQLLFRSVCELYPCVVISGRSMSDVGARLGDAQVLHVVGNHGLEPGLDLAEFATEVALVLPLLQRSLRELPGVEVEEKSYSLAIHYRRSRTKRVARSLIHQAVASLPVPMRVVGGKLVVNVIPTRAAHKGNALLQLRERTATTKAFYIGDDVTDEDVFTLDEADRLLTVRVGRSKNSAAQYFLRDQSEVDALLGNLIELRRGRPK